MRQLRILYKRGSAGQFRPLEEFVHHSLYGRKEVYAAADVMRAHDYIEGVALRLDDELFNLVTFEQEAIAPKSFALDTFRGKDDTLTINEPVDEQTVFNEAAKATYGG